MTRLAPYFLALAALVAGCATTRPVVAGQPFVEEGLASWYGREAQGGPTASGERFDMHAFTAAHRRLPFNTLVVVENLRNGRRVTVRVNDRGPYGRGRIIDVSFAAARALGMVNAGVVPARIYARP